jgi:hypothetical protein
MKLAGHVQSHLDALVEKAVPYTTLPYASAPAASVVQLPWYLQKDSNGRDVPTLLKLLTVKDKMIDALLREKTHASSSVPSLSSPPPPPPTAHAFTQTIFPDTTSTLTQCDPPASSPNATDVLSLLHSVHPLAPPNCIF